MEGAGVPEINGRFLRVGEVDNAPKYKNYLVSIISIVPSGHIPGTTMTHTSMLHSCSGKEYIHPPQGGWLCIPNGSDGCGGVVPLPKVCVYSF